MATKRMFDKAIVDTDRFMDLSMSMKGTYFVFGMEADDEGFVSYKKVVRIHGVNEDDIKVLIAKGFFISFESGVVVITDWNKNNWLNKNRIKPTEYQKEKKLLELTEDKTYVLSTGLALAKPEEKRGVENRGVEKKENVAIAPAFSLPSFVDPKVWDEWLEYRKEIKKKMTPATIKKQLKLLAENEKDYKEIIERSIQNGWTGLFPLKDSARKKHETAKTGKYAKFNE